MSDGCELYYYILSKSLNLTTQSLIMIRVLIQAMFSSRKNVMWYSSWRSRYSWLVMSWPSASVRSKYLISGIRKICSPFSRLVIVKYGFCSTTKRPTVSCATATLMLSPSSTCTSSSNAVLPSAWK